MNCNQYCELQVTRIVRFVCMYQWEGPITAPVTQHLGEERHRSECGQERSRKYGDVKKIQTKLNSKPDTVQ